MTKIFNNLDIYTLNDNTFSLIDKSWFLLTAGDKDYFNTMTAAWGSFGILWKKPVITIFVRPTRYTYGFTEKNKYFTLSFFNESYRSILNYCGTKSGRDVNKVRETGLIPISTETGNVFFEQANLVFECKKIYFDDLKPDNFLSDNISKNYPLKDYHRFYIGEIINCFNSIN